MAIRYGYYEGVLEAGGIEEQPAPGDGRNEKVDQQEVEGKEPHRFFQMAHF